MKTLAISVVFLIAVAVTSNAADDKAKEVKPTQEWSGSIVNQVADLPDSRPADGVITDKETFGKVWKAWKGSEKEPAVDFKKEVVVAEKTQGSRLGVSARLTADGDLKVEWMATRDIRPGFRFRIAVFPREGVKTVNGKALPKE